jgi:hypothetical protein
MQLALSALLLAHMLNGRTRHSLFNLNCLLMFEVLCFSAGGEGATAREVLRHRSIEKLIMCDIDKVGLQVEKVTRGSPSIVFQLRASQWLSNKSVSLKKTPCFSIWALSFCIRPICIDRRFGRELHGSGTSHAHMLIKFEHIWSPCAGSRRNSQGHRKYSDGFAFLSPRLEGSFGCVD